MNRAPAMRLCLWLIAVSACSSFAIGSESLVVYGAGSAGMWTTEFTFANRGSEETTVGIGDAPIQICPPLAQCYQFVTVPPQGTVSAEFRSSLRSGIGAAYLFTGTDPLAVSILARAHAPGAGCTSVDLPVLTITTLLRLNPDSLVLPGARRGEAGRSNLLLANVFDPEGPGNGPVEIGIEALDADGASLGQTSTTVPYGETTFISDVLGILGAGEVENGQIRLTKLGGSGVMWGLMPITRSDGSFSVSLGLAP